MTREHKCVQVAQSCNPTIGVARPGGQAVMETLKKFTIRLYPADVAILKTAYPVRGYTQAIRTAVHKLARTIERRFAGKQAST